MFTIKTMVDFVIPILQIGDIPHLMVLHKRNKLFLTWLADCSFTDGYYYDDAVYFGFLISKKDLIDLLSGKKSVYDTYTANYIDEYLRFIVTDDQDFIMVEPVHRHKMLEENLPDKNTYLDFHKDVSVKKYIRHLKYNKPIEVSEDKIGVL